MIGSGINGLACAVRLAKAGWKVLVLERNATAGGALQTAEPTLPGFQHDLYATNMSLFAGSAFHRDFGADLSRHGLEWLTASHTFSSVFPDGSYAGVSRDIEETIASLDAFCPADGDAWRAMAAGFPERAARIFPVLNERAPSRDMCKVFINNLRSGGMDWLQDIRDLFMSTPRRFSDRHFRDPRTQSLAAEVSGTGVTANVVLPSTIDTPGNRAGMPGSDFSKWVPPDHIASTMLFLCSDSAASINGESIRVYHRA